MTQLLQVEKRQEELQHLQRKKREYIKSDSEFWTGNGKSEAAKKFPKISTVPNPTPNFTKQDLQQKKANDLLQLLSDHYQIAMPERT